MPIRLLYLEDSPRDIELIRDKLEAGGLDCDIVCADNQKAFATALAGPAFDVVLCDHNLPGYDGRAALKRVREQCPGTPVILISGTLDEEQAVECLQLGATDYVLKQRLQRLPAAVTRALAEAGERDRRQHSEQLLTWEKNALELIVGAGALGATLDGLMLGLEQRVPEALCSVLLLDDDGIHLRHGAAPSLPPAYNGLIDGVAIGARVGSCGTAAHENRQVIVTDIGSDPLWADYRELALGHGLRACWSTPIHNRQGNILGTFAIYYRTPRSPTRAELELIERAKNLVGLALERRQADERLRQSEARLVNAQRMARLGSWELDLGHRAAGHRHQLRWSDEVFRIFGHPPGAIEVSNENFFRAVHPEDRPRIQAAMAQAVRERQPYDLIHRIVLPDGSQRIVREHAEIQGDETSGPPLKMVGTVQDITALKAAEQALEESEALYESLVEHLPLSVFRKDREGRFTFANARFCAAMGKPLAEVFGQTDFDIAPAELARKYRDADRQVMATGQVLEMVEENRSATGQTRFLQVLKAPLRNAAGDIVGIQGIFMDVTERKELEEQLRQSQKMEAIGQLAGGVAHDFNNLLTIIQGNSQLLLTQANLPEDTTEQIRQIYTAGERAADLTRQLLTFSRKQKFAPRALDLNESIRNITKMLQRIIGEDITLQCAFAPSLPSVLADASMMDQILLNLSVNARDAMSKGGRLTIETAVVELDAEQARRHPDARAGRFVCLNVRDTGIGIAPEHLAHIFEPFFTTKEVGKGTGLGLATVFGIVQQHHGWIEVESALGTGTTFKMFLPATAVKATPATETTRKVRGGTETILVVEDEETLRHIVLMVLRKHGYRVLEAASGVKALAVWAEHAAEIDLLLTDLVMPDGVTGRELAEQLLAKRPGLKVIYTSGYSPEFAGSDLALKDGVNFLQKPYRPQQLAQTVRDCLDD